MKSYSEVIKFKTFSERLEYLKLLDNNVTSPRHISMDFYKSSIWRNVRRLVIDRDMGFDLGVFGVYITGHIIVHHINPIDEFDIINMTDKLTNLENLICVSGNTHNLIHYNMKVKDSWEERRPGDTKLW